MVGDKSLFLTTSMGVLTMHFCYVFVFGVRMYTLYGTLSNTYHLYNITNTQISSMTFPVHSDGAGKCSHLVPGRVLALEQFLRVF